MNIWMCDDAKASFIWDLRGIIFSWFDMCLLNIMYSSGLVWCVINSGPLFRFWKKSCTFSFDLIIHNWLTAFKVCSDSFNIDQTLPLLQLICNSFTITVFFFMVIIQFITAPKITRSFLTRPPPLLSNVSVGYGGRVGGRGDVVSFAGEDAAVVFVGRLAGFWTVRRWRCCFVSVWEVEKWRCGLVRWGCVWWLDERRTSKIGHGSP